MTATNPAVICRHRVAGRSAWENPRAATIVPRSAPRWFARQFNAGVFVLSCDAANSGRPPHPSVMSCQPVGSGRSDLHRDVSAVGDPGYMSRKVRRFRKNKFDTRNRLKF